MSSRPSQPSHASLPSAANRRVKPHGPDDPGSPGHRPTGRSRARGTARRAFALLSLLALVASSLTMTAPTMANHVAPGASGWCLAGEFNGWDNASTPLYDDGTNGDLLGGDEIFSRDVVLGGAGRHEFKVVECGNWDNAHPSQNAWALTTDANQTVKFTFDTNSHTDGYAPATNIVNAWADEPASFTAVGDFQGWTNDDPATALTDLGGGLHRLAHEVAEPGSYMAKIVATGSWSEQFVADGRAVDGSPIGFTTTEADETVIFLLDTFTGRWTVRPNGAGSASWCVAGEFNGWDNASTPLHDDGSNGDLLGGDGIYSREVTFAGAGSHQFKAVECGNWDNAHPQSNNAWALTTQPDQTVRLTFDTNTYADGLLPATNIVNAADGANDFTAVGDFQGWSNDNPATALTDRGNGWHVGNLAIPSAGSQIAKVTRTGTWDAIGADGRSVDAANIAFETFADGQVAHFVLDARAGRVAIIGPSSDGGGGDPGHDNNIFWDDLGHNSRDGAYRTPGGPVTTGTPVKLRLSAASGDLTEARVRVWDDRVDTSMMLPMSLVADDGTHEWWEATVPASSEPTIYWYRFIAIDGTATAFYEDDNSRTGGWGQTFGSSPDNSWQLTVYDPAFETPEWVKNATIYQIFVDRFRDGDPTNNPPGGDFFYEETPTVYRSYGEDWHEPICDPRDATSDCPGVYSQNFYGGDLDGIRDKLDYLEDLGITALYLNPIFESPSNHKYDTTDFTRIDPAFGDLETFTALASEAAARGMRLILDGVFNHTSSDSLYFDRYGRYETVGACESHESPYREWYYFQPVAAGTGPCVGDDGTPGAANYESWFGFDSLPKLRATNPEVRDFIYASGTDSVARYWLQWADGWRLDVAGDVDPGATNDPSNTFWEEFRLAVREQNPEAYIVGEEWGLATPWTLGHEWDATMNYQLSSAVLSFFRDTAFTDNDHNSGSSAGVLSPLTPTQLGERLLNLEERYPPEAFYALMNLLGSHDTNRPLFMLDHNAHHNDRSIYENPAYDWSDAITRQKGVALLQLTMPGAPTIYYGDEVGLVAPPTYDGSTWQDDPYNRIPYPWLDESGTPFYAHLQSEAGQAELRDHYVTLLGARNSHPALRTGSFDPLLSDDGDGVYAYGRLLAEHGDAALVVANRSGAPRSVTLELGGYLPVGATFEGVLGGGSYTVGAGGQLDVDVPARGGELLVLSGSLAAAPEAVSDLAVTAERSAEIDLAWTATSGADSYLVYRSLLSGGGYDLVDSTAATTFTDTGLTNAQRYHYVVVARDDATLLVSGHSNEASGIPQHDLSSAWFNLQWPFEITHTISTTTPTETVYGQIWIDGETGPAGPADGIRAQVGWGALDSTPDESWTWTEMTFNAASGNNDEYAGAMLPDQLGEFHYTTRFSGNGGLTWHVADRDGPGYVAGNGGLLSVLASSDVSPPSAPVLEVTGIRADRIDLSWTPSDDDVEVAGYEVFRDGAKIGQTGASVTTYADESVAAGTTYSYQVRAFDTSFNRSAFSNAVNVTAENRLVDVTFLVGVPEFTPPSATVYVTGSIGALGPWNPSANPMTDNGDGTWQRTFSIPDGTSFEWKYTRGSWETVEKWGEITGLANRGPIVADYGSDGSMLIDNTTTDWGTGSDSLQAVENWRDPIVVSHSPADEATDVSTDTTISVDWSKAMTSATQFSVTGPGGAVAGTFALSNASRTVTFTPSAELAAASEYTVTVSGQTDGEAEHQQVTVVFNFTTAAGDGPEHPVSYPAVFRDGTWFLRDSNTADPGTVESFAFGDAGDHPIFGDWNGDGVVTPGVVRVTGGSLTWFLRNSNTSGVADITFSFGDATDTPIVGDWNGDGTDTIGLVRGNWWLLRNTNSAGDVDLDFFWGDATDHPIVGDWNGDGTDTIGLVRGANWWLLRNTNSDGPTDLDFFWGALDENAWVVGDWNGDGMTNPGILRGNWWLLRAENSDGPTTSDFFFGMDTDRFAVWAR